ncbi:right-handed parallel beta-helix repeat-containing protein [Pseudomonas costantinii]|uniref:right-handed parallel beta-helix repeat-containing protein n=1 Tax=Pseudomonas costantinii TaxID=168469 RepID=UPI0015A14FE8|nr:right-handed parallel beta-helix repeat-containing protein [Pseudomonas costantinii]NVZ69119.1 right-handed parallel beta-helix repeat-containing protein [Pseudomonas costantinii]
MPPLIRISLFATLLGSALTCQAEPQTLPLDRALSVIPAQQHHDQQVELLNRTRQAVQMADVPIRRPTGRAQVSLQPMFSSQQGSWPFEPFVNNGLFRAIAGYQSHHPQAVVISGGSITLAQLADALHDPRVLRRHKDGYLLSYPLMITANGGLILEGTSLYLYNFSGTALINQGLLSLNQSRLEGWTGEKTSDTDRAYRPFVVSWAGSSTQILDSTLSRLGYNANLSQGLSTAISTQQAANTPAANVLIRNSHFTELSTGVNLQHARAQIEQSTFEQQQQYAIDLNNSQAQLRGNSIRGVENNSGIRVRGQTRALIKDNLILTTAKAGIEVSEQAGALLITGNRIGDSKGNGIQLRNLSGNDGALMIVDNLISNSQGSAIDASEVQSLAILDNRITTSPEYAISLRNAAPLPGELALTGNRLGAIGKAVVRVEGIDNVVLGHNRYQGKPMLQNLLIGDLMPVQSLLLDATVRQNCVVQIRRSPDAAPPSALACTDSSLAQ